MDDLLRLLSALDLADLLPTGPRAPIAHRVPVRGWVLLSGWEGWPDGTALAAALVRLRRDPDRAGRVDRALEILGWQALARPDAPADRIAAVWAALGDGPGGIVDLALGIRDREGRLWWLQEGMEDPPMIPDHALAALGGWDGASLDPIVRAVWPDGPPQPDPRPLTRTEAIDALEMLMEVRLYFGHPWPMPPFERLMDELQPRDLLARVLPYPTASGEGYELQILVRSEGWDAVLLGATTTA